MARVRSKKPGFSGGPPLQPVTAAPGQEYGARKAQEDAQRAVPMAAAPPAPVPGAGPQAAPGGPLPGEGGDFLRPTERPGEPLTAGAPVGPGPGPEALAMNRFGANPDLAALAPYLATLELMASQPNASPASRNFVRRLRGAVGTAQVNRAAAPTSPPPPTAP